jgi:hypothetical protein
MGGKPWTGSELLQMRECYRHLPIKELRKLFVGRSDFAIKNQAVRMGLTDKRRNRNCYKTAVAREPSTVFL